MKDNHLFIKSDGDRLTRSKILRAKRGETHREAAQRLGDLGWDITVTNSVMDESGTIRRKETL